MTLLTLSLRYEFSRRRLEALVTRHGLNHPQVLAQSRRVDRMVVELQRRMEIKEVV